MNWKTNISKNSTIIILLMVLIMFILFYFRRNNEQKLYINELLTTIDDLEYKSKSDKINQDNFLNITNNLKTESKFKKIRYEEFSPDRLRKIISYNMIYDPRLYDGYYEEYFPNQTIISAQELDNKNQYYVYTGEERTGNPHWLGNEYVYFTIHCGTGCQGIDLVNVDDKETRQGGLSYMFKNDSKNSEYTHFSDWFGREFEFDGFVKDITSETKGGKSYLIFKLENTEGKSVGQKRFLFTTNKLTLQL